MLRDLANYYAAQGYAVDFVLGTGQTFFEDSLSKEINRIYLDATRAAACVVPLSKYLKNQKPDLIITGLEQNNVALCIAQRLAKYNGKVVLTTHTLLSTEAKRSGVRNRFTLFLASLLYKKASLIAPVSEGVKQDMIKTLKLSSGSVTVVKNTVSIDIKRLSKEPVDNPWFAVRQPPVILSVGRLSYEKNLSSMIRAFDLVRKEIPCNLLLLGEGPERSNLTELVSRLNLTEHVQMPGRESNPFKYMSKCAVFVMSSRYEGMPSSLIEAMICGAPVVSTDCPTGPSEIISESRPGKLVPVDDDQALAKAIIETIGAPVTVPLQEMKPFLIESSGEQILDLTLRAR